MCNIGTKRLETERLILRQGTVKDASDIFNNYCSDPLVVKYVSWDAHKNIKDSIKYLEYMEDNYKKDNFYIWFIEDKKLKQVIGSIGVVNGNDKFKVYEIGYAIGSKWWSKGYMTESLKEVIKFLFEEVGAETIHAKHLSENPASGKVMIKCGMKFEGTLRNRKIDKNTNRHSNLESYSILREEYL
ncbi:MAG: GNAT family N-acetyltransferase [Bacilli bacterium]|nr:GNAT family N-acetyltransferase [Bacilli bacterium]